MGDQRDRCIILASETSASFSNSCRWMHLSLIKLASTGWRVHEQEQHIYADYSRVLVTVTYQYYVGLAELLACFINCPHFSCNLKFLVMNKLLKTF